MTKEDIRLVASNLANELDAAIIDSEACERDPEYKIKMSYWHDVRRITDNPPICFVCLAGSVMAKTHKVSRTESATPGVLDIAHEQRKSLYALEELRRGRIVQGIQERALSELYKDDIREAGFANTFVPDYRQHHPEAFKEDMAKVSRLLRNPQ